MPSRLYLVLGIIALLWAGNPCAALAAEIRLGKFLVQETPDKEVETYAALRISHGKQVIMEADVSRGTVEGTTIRQDFPVPGCRTMVIPVFTGGAHCCFELYLASQCGGEDRLYSVGLGHSDDAEFTDLNADGRMEMIVDDWSFAYYGPDGGEVSMSFAESLPFPRVFVHDKDGWRVDHPGEFAGFYTAKRRELEQEFKDPDPGPAIVWAALALMEGLPQKDVAVGFVSRLPKDWRPVAQRVMDDVLGALRQSGELCSAIPLDSKQ